ncbi:MAG: hypothetical protein A2293_12605 [Elusimicrobia bacterium RIFOXYB2_FULL_49_7]|nr:MAG: hypothetical protein A2293_12605 [Elusimicrobia bacterium RIFOXYB2_FULL_49_7]
MEKKMENPGKSPGSADYAPGWSMKHWIIFSLSCTLLFIVLSALGIYLVYSHLKKELPSIEQLENIEPNLITRIYSEDGVLLKEFFTERRIWRRLDEMPPHVYQAVISIEDKRFWHHWGMNVYAIPAILSEAATSGRSLRGGSTLTQQLARNLYASIGSERSYIRKIKELFTAFQIEKTYTKEDVLQFYLNQVYMGGGAYGFQAAAQKYFNKSTLTALTLAEAATLAAIIQRPEYYRPDVNSEHVLKRRNLVLSEMHQDGLITSKAYRQAVSQPVVTVEQEEKAGKAPYFVEMVRSYLEKQYGAKALYGSGYTIRTTLNDNLQERAESLATIYLDSLQYSLDAKFINEMGLRKKTRLSMDSLRANLPFHIKQTAHLFSPLYSATETQTDSTGKIVKKLVREALPDSMKYRKIQIALAILDNKSGAIRALIGGRNYEESKFNRVTQAFRQPGSAFKPFIYTAAIDNGYTASTIMLDQAFSIPDPILGEWRPENYNREFRGEITLRRALASSINTVAIKLQQKVGTVTVINYAVNMGLDRKHLSAVPSLAIGSCEAIPLSLFSAYSAIPNGGVRADPFFINDIYDRQENLVEAHYTVLHNVLNPRTAYVMTSMLHSVVSSGTAISAYAKGVNFPAGGKTGTTNDYTDAWFVGFTPDLTCGVWVGSDEKRSLGEGRTGSSAALPLWTDCILYAYDSLTLFQKRDFDIPQGVTFQRVCKVSWMLAGEKCDSVMDEVFVVGTEPPLCNRDHSVQRQDNGSRLDPFGTRRGPRPSSLPLDSTQKKKQKLFMM